MPDDPLHDKLTSELAEAGWRLLAPHFARGALLICDERVGLVEAAVALARDEVAVVAEWLNAGALRKPTEAEAAAWATSAPAFRFLIVQPFVVAEVLPPAA